MNEVPGHYVSLGMTIPSQAEYEAREAEAFQRQLRNAEQGTLAEKRAYARKWEEAIRTRPDLVAQRIGWLLAGNYGFGSYKAAERALTSPNIHHFVWFTCTIAALEWTTSRAVARAACDDLPAAERARLQRAIEGVLREHLRENPELSPAPAEPVSPKAKRDSWNRPLQLVK
jgi:hypothetical protein